MGSLFWVVFLEDLYDILISDFYVAFGGSLSRPRSRFDPIGESEPVSGCETIYWDSLLLFLFFIFYFFIFFQS